VVVALGLIIPLTGGDYDLSVASVVSLSAMLVAILNVNRGWPIGWAIAVALLAGLLVGVVNGAVIVLLEIDSLIVTLGMSTFVSGLVLWMSGSNTVSGISEHLVNPVIVWRLAGIPFEFWYAMAVALIVWYVFRYMPVGRRLLVVGRGREVARLSGIRVGRIRWVSFAVSAVVAAFGGILYAARPVRPGPTSGLELLLPAFAAAFLGATTIHPGRFNPGARSSPCTSWSPASPGCSCWAPSRTCRTSSTGPPWCSPWCSPRSSGDAVPAEPSDPAGAFADPLAERLWTARAQHRLLPPDEGWSAVDHSRAAAIATELYRRAGAGVPTAWKLGAWTSRPGHGSGWTGRWSLPCCRTDCTPTPAS
jgi:branched-subunit amino acid ABC-type transport system permease component